MGKPLIVYWNVPAFKEWATNFKLLFQALETTVENEKYYNPKVHLAYSDIAVDNVVSLNIKLSKMDQFRKGVKVVI